MRLIDADALIPMMKYATTDNEIGVFPIRIGFDAIKRVIDDAPTIDAVDVVRCKDCKWWQDSEVGVVECPICTRIHDMVFEMGAYDHCSKGKRREESEVEE